MSGINAGDWVKLHTGDQVTEINGRHVGRGDRKPVLEHHDVADAERIESRSARSEMETHGQIDASAALARTGARRPTSARLPVLLCRP